MQQGIPLSGLRRRASSSHDQPKAVMKILHVISSVNPETGGPIEVIMTSASVLSAHPSIRRSIRGRGP
jgi:hypothetical protein